jgi:hypothetical protein
MTDIYLSQAEIEKMLKSLHLNQTESPNIDGKETLNLKSEGDCATFIRHIAALANTGQKSYLIIGVEDKTWILKGISEDSSLRDADGTQQQMNQILANRLDPSVSICYRTYLINGAVIGAVGVEGKTRPYVVSIEDSRYGEAKTKGKESYIYRGVIYVRRGTSSVAANRHSEILRLFEGRRDIVGIVISLAFIGALVGSGVGVGTSVWKFGDPYGASLLGGVWGLAIGWIFNQRLVETIGRFPAGLLGRVFKSSVGLTWGAIIGASTSYMMINNILSGKLKAPNPVLMGLITGPMAAVITVLFIVVLVFDAYVSYTSANMMVDRLKRKNPHG